MRAPRPAALRPGVRRVYTARRGRVRRASAGLTRVRVLALAAMIAVVAGIYAIATTTVFAARTIVVEGATFTPDAVARETIGLAGGENLVALRTRDIADRLAALSTVAAARVEIALPQTVTVSLAERHPILTWHVGDTRFLVDRDGTLFADVSLLSGPGRATADSLPTIDDRRAESAALAVGSRLDAVDIDAASRLGALSPADLGSASKGLQLRVDDDQGYVVQGSPAGWTAVFGFYTPELRTTELIPGQVRLLRSLLTGREAQITRVVLADDRNGTYVPRGGALQSPAPTNQPLNRPSRRPSVATSPRPTVRSTPAPSSRPSRRPSVGPSPQASVAPSPRRSAVPSRSPKPSPPAASPKPSP